jgi:phage gpG-like protein
MAGTTISGNGFAVLDRLSKQLAKSPSILRAVAKNMAEEALDLVAQGFADERDPYGIPWAPLKVRQGKILQDTARLKRSWHRKRIDAAGFTIGSGVSYASFHQEGTRRLPPRKMVPDAGNLPPRWRKAIVQAAVEAFDEHFNG